MKKIGIALCFCCVMALFAACTDNSYLNAVPRESTALLSIDPVKMSGLNHVSVLRTLLQATNISKSGIDVSHKIMLFEAPDGNLGVCAKVQDEDELTQTFAQLATKNVCPAPIKRRGFHFTVLKDAWVVGWNNTAMLVMGPVTVEAQSSLQQQIAQYLKQDEAAGITQSRLYEKLDSLEGSMTLVAQATALPQQFLAPLTLGMPKKADGSEVIIAAEMEKEQQVMHIKGEVFSLNATVNQSLKQAYQLYRPITDRYLSATPRDAMLSMFLNVDGQKFLPVMQNNAGFQALLTGINTAIDMDNILRSVDGDLALVTPYYDEHRLSMWMMAQLKHKNWVKDVGYWKKSCPAGGRIVDWKPDAWYYASKETTFYFGVTPQLQFFSGSTVEEASQAFAPAKQQLSATEKNLIKGQKLALVINMNALQGGKTGAVTAMLQPIFGDVHTLIYTLK